MKQNRPGRSREVAVGNHMFRGGMDRQICGGGGEEGTEPYVVRTGQNAKLLLSITCSCDGPDSQLSIY